MAESTSPVRAEKPHKAFSCLRCFERKVKCDKVHPCAGCVKANVECHFRIPSAPRRKKKRGTEEILLERLKRAEDLLRSKGIDGSTRSGSISSPSTTELGPSPQHALLSGLTTEPERTPLDSTRDSNENFFDKARFSAGKLIQVEGRARFIDNNLWSSLSEEFHPKDAVDEYYSSDDDEDTLADESNEFILGLTPNSNAVQHLHPTPENIIKIWQIFLENVNPMTKIIHFPSLQEKIMKARMDILNIPRALEALMFAIYNSAIISLDDSECESMFGESKKGLLSRYSQGARRALSRARFLGTADLVVLQAFVLYVLSIRSETDARTVWTLSGVASRIAQSMGVHRDGTNLGVPPFETEMRRRLWWQITILDFRSAELNGNGRFGDISLSDTSVPTNVNDSELWPGMKTAPTGTTRPTEMVACLLRCEFGSFWKEKLLQKSAARDSNDAVTELNSAIADTKLSLTPWNASTEERDGHIDELEQRLEDKFLRYCEPQSPIQFMASLIGRAAVTSMRLMAHHPRRWKDESQIPDAERALLWGWAIKLLDGDNLAHSSKTVRRFMWHTKIYFQWQALIYVLTELQKHTTGEEIDNAWTHVDEVFDNHPEFITEWKKPLHVAIGGLVLKAWVARLKGRQEASARGEFMSQLTTPDYIEMLHQHKSMPKTRRSERTTSQSTTVSPPPATQTTPNESMFAPIPQQQTPLQSDMLWEPATTGEGNFAFNAFASAPTAQFYYDPNVVASAFDPNAAMNWTQWDYLLQDFEMTGRNSAAGSM